MGLQTEEDNKPKTGANQAPSTSANTVELPKAKRLVSFEFQIEDSRTKLDKKVEYPKRGHLVLCGGGSFDENSNTTNARIIYKELAALAPKSPLTEKKKIIFIPTASAGLSAVAETINGRNLIKDAWKHRGFDEVEILHFPDDNSQKPEEKIEMINRCFENATAIWINGGDQERLLRLGTEFEEKAHALLNSGGVVGGTSAGTAFLSDTIVVDQNIDTNNLKINIKIGTGLPTLRGLVPEQHFSARHRNNRLEEVLDFLSKKDKGSTPWGMAVDENTAAIVNIADKNFRVLGQDHVHIFSLNDQGKFVSKTVSGKDPVFDLSKLILVNTEKKD